MGFQPVVPRLWYRLYLTIGLDKMIDLNGKRALVCGSTKGIGRACAMMLAKAGAAVTAVARDAAALTQLVAELTSQSAGGEMNMRPGEMRGSRHDYVVVDFRDPPAVRAAVAGHVQRAGPIEILVNNTGGPAPGPILEAQPEQFIEALQMHVLCNHALAQTLVPGMKQRGYGRIINIISTSVREPIPGIGVSNTTRWAVAAWAKTLSREVAPFGITVNNVLPGFTATERLTELFDSRAAREQKSREQVADAARQLIPAGRFAEPSEIAAAVAFLASPIASYVNGINLPVDGGRLASL